MEREDDIDHTTGSELADPAAAPGANAGGAYGEERAGRAADDGTAPIGGGASGGPADPIATEQRDPDDDAAAPGSEQGTTGPS
jgi:hypothetical protein